MHVGRGSKAPYSLLPAQLPGPWWSLPPITRSSSAWSHLQAGLDGCLLLCSHLQHSQQRMHTYNSVQSVRDIQLVLGAADSLGHAMMSCPSAPVCLQAHTRHASSITPRWPTHWFACCPGMVFRQLHLVQIQAVIGPAGHQHVAQHNHNSAITCTCACRKVKAWGAACDGPSGPTVLCCQDRPLTSRPRCLSPNPHLSRLRRARAAAMMSGSSSSICIVLMLCM